jgi:hypothetical protein
MHFLVYGMLRCLLATCSLQVHRMRSGRRAPTASQRGGVEGDIVPGTGARREGSLVKLVADAVTTVNSTAMPAHSRCQRSRKKIPQRRVQMSRRRPRCVTPRAKH